ARIARASARAFGWGCAVAGGRWGEQTGTGWVSRAGWGGDEPRPIVFRGESGCVSEWRFWPADPAGRPRNRAAEFCGRAASSGLVFTTWPLQGVFSRLGSDGSSRRTAFGL